MTFSFFVPRIDDGSDSQPVIINAVSGDDAISPNNTQLGDNNTGDSNNQWIPVDSRDTTQEVFVQPNPNTDDSEHRLEDRSIAIQKTVANITDSSNSPGDILEYTLEFQVSDYFAFQNIDIIDTFSDGQRFNNSFTPTLTVSEHGNTSRCYRFFYGYSYFRRFSYNTY
ncbi:MAG: hypothetical protein QNJ41_07750 [Xenococcaceae cyanobacterium MO_188.B32]|nr:hypothetical protein [Xenococcaceae cyanobacterium MO_188.B32]